MLAVAGQRDFETLGRAVLTYDRRGPSLHHPERFLEHVDCSTTRGWLEVSYGDLIEHVDLGVPVRDDPLQSTDLLLEYLEAFSVVNFQTA